MQRSLILSGFVMIALGSAACGGDQGSGDVVTDRVAPNDAPDSVEGGLDAGPPDTASPDGNASDAGFMDAGSPDAASLDGGTPDAGCGLLTVTCLTGCCPVAAVSIAPAGSSPSVAVDSVGYVYVSFRGATGTSLAIFDPTRVAWTTQTVDGVAARSVVRVDSAGRVHQLWGSDITYAGGTGQVTYRFSDDHGATWTTRPLPGTLGIGATMDLAIGAGSVPNVVFQPQTGALVYAEWTGTAWNTQSLDTTTGSDSDAVIALDAEGRPHIAASSESPGGLNSEFSMRHIYFDGAVWNAENLEAPSLQGSYGEFTHVVAPYLADRIDVLPDDSVQVVFVARTVGSAAGMFVATRPTGVTPAWTITPLTGISPPPNNPWYIPSVSGAPAVLTDGLSVYRQGGSGTWASTTTGPVGTQAGAAVVGVDLYVAYTSGAAGTSGQLLLSRLTP